MLRNGRVETEVLLVHRKRYNDWSLPKGKLNQGETLVECAFRETLEETGVEVDIQTPLDTISFEVGSALKTVSYWRAAVRKDRGHVPNTEVDRVRWFPLSKALPKASYPEDPLLIKQAATLPPTTPFLIVRHGKAVARSDWVGDDRHRPLAEHGQLQSQRLVSLLDVYGVRKIASSTSTRCIQTFEPFARDAKLQIEGWAALSEEDAAQAPWLVTELVERLLAETASSGCAMAVCGHRPVLPLMSVAAGITAKPLRPAAFVVVHIDSDGKAVALERQPPIM